MRRSALCTNGVVSRPQASGPTLHISGVTPHENFDTMPSIRMLPSAESVTMALSGSSHAIHGTERGVYPISLKKDSG